MPAIITCSSRGWRIWSRSPEFTIREAALSAFAETGGFTPVCTTEIMTFASMQKQFAAQNTALRVLSVDSNPSHIAWSREMNRFLGNGGDAVINFPIVADTFGQVAKLYGMIMPSSSSTKTVRNVYIIDPEGTVRAVLMYPLTTGRNMAEIYRLVLALQSYDRTGHPTPADWEPGGDHVLPPPNTLPESYQRLEGQTAHGYRCLDWYVCFTNDGKSRPDMGVMPATGAMPKMPNMGMMPAAGAMPKMPNMGVMPATGAMPEMPKMPNMGMMPATGAMPEMPKIPNMGVMPATGAMPEMPKMPNMGTMPSAVSENETCDSPVPGRPFKPDNTDRMENASIMEQNRMLLRKPGEPGGTDPLSGWHNHPMPR